MLTINIIIGGHYGPRLRFLDGDLKSFQVDLPESPLRHDGVVHKTVGLLVVCSIMLEGGAHTVALDPVYHGCGYLAAKERVFRIVFEVPSAQRVAVDVDSRCEQHIDSVFLGLASHCPSCFSHYLRVPCGRNQRADREACAIECPVVSRTVRPDTHSCRAVSQHDSRHAQTWNLIDHAGCSRGLYLFICLRLEHLGAASDNQFAFLFDCQFLYDSVDVVFIQFQFFGAH